MLFSLKLCNIIKMYWTGLLFDIIYMRMYKCKYYTFDCNKLKKKTFDILKLKYIIRYNFFYVNFNQNNP